MLRYDSVRSGSGALDINRAIRIIAVMQIGEELRKARIDAGLTQEALAKKAKVHRVYVSVLERDEKSPTLAVFFRLCRAMEISPSTLVSRIERRS